MIDRLFKFFSFVTGLMVIGAIFGLAAFTTTVEIKDLDLWLHIATGRFISIHHYVPNVDFLSCTINGAPWINHEWLFQVLIYKLYAIGGFVALQHLQTVIVVMSLMFLLLIGYNRDRQVLVAGILFLVYMVFQQRFTIRPDIFSLLFFSIYIYVLSIHIDKKWSIPVLFLVQLLWTNMHGFFFFGPVFILIALLSEWIKRRIPLPYQWNESGRLTDDEFKRLSLVFLAVVLASLFNPSTVYGAGYPLSVFFSLGGENKIFFNYIQELQRPIAWANLFDMNRYIYYKLLIMFSLITFVFNRRHIDVSALMLWLVFLFFSLTAIRNTIFFAFAAYLIILTNCLSVQWETVVPLRFVAPRFQSMTAIAINALMLMWVINLGTDMSVLSYYDPEKYEYKSEFGGVSLRTYPTQAVDFLVENKIKGNFFNDFNSGAYLLGRCFPNVKVFIDGRTEVYGGDFFKQYQKIWEGRDTKLLDHAVDKYKLTGVLLNSVSQRIPVGILRYFVNHKSWIPVYFDYDAVIFLKDIPENKLWIDKFRLDLKNLTLKKYDLFKIGTARYVPYQNYYRAYTLESLDYDDEAMSELEAALQIDPNYPEAHELMGKIFAKRKDFEKAFESFRIAAVNNPSKKELRFNLAMTYMDMGKYEGAVKQYEIMKGLWPQDAKICFLYAKALLKNRQFDKAVSAIKDGHKLDLKDVLDILELGDLLREGGQAKLAIEVFELIPTTSKETATVYHKIGLAYQDLKDYEKAKESFEKCLKIKPNNIAVRTLLDATNQLLEKH